MPERLSRREWDLNELMDRVGGDEEFLRELLVIFRQEGHMNVEKARTTLEQGDLAGLSHAAHTLKGMLKGLAMGAAAETAEALERAAHSRRAEECGELLARLGQDLEEILPEVEAQLADMKS